MKDDAALKDQDSDCLGRETGHCTRIGGHLCQDHALSDVLNQERQEDTSHDNGRGGSLVAKTAQALIAKHELGVGVQMDEGGGDDDTCAELLENKEDGVRLSGHPLDHEDGEVDSESASDQDHKEETNTQRNVIVARDLFAASRAAATLALACADAMLDTGVEVAVFALRFFSASVVVVGRLSTLGNNRDIVSVRGETISISAMSMTISEGRRYR